MDTQSTNGSSWSDQFKSFMGWFAVISGVLAVSVEVFLHRSRTFGERYIGINAALVLIAVPFYTLFWDGYDVMPLMLFLVAFMFMCFMARTGVLVRLRQGGPQEHTRYTGYPRILRLLPKLGERTVKLIVEPMAVFLTGVFTMSFSEPLGGYLMVASVGLLASVHLSVGYDRNRSLDMHDASIDQRHVAEGFRELRGDRR